MVNMEFIFYVSSIIGILSTFLVIIHTNPMHALLYFIISLLSISCIFFSLGASFAGALEIIIYASAIVVLFIFVIMMLNLSIYNNIEDNIYDCSVKKVSSCSLLFILFMILIYTVYNLYDYHIVTKSITPKIVGMSLFGPYILAVELASMILLTGLITIFHFSYNMYHVINDT